MSSIVKYFLDNPLVGNLLMFFLFLMGFFGFMSLKSTLMPERDYRLITIQLVYPGSSPEEVEKSIITKVEENLKGLDGIERTTSISSENIGQVFIEVLKGFDVNHVLRDVKNVVDKINAFPTDMERPVISKKEYESFALNFALYGDVSLQKLKAVSRKIEQDLLDKDGISKIYINGFPEEEIEISIRELDLRRFQLSFSEVAAVIQKANLNATGGKIKSKEEEFLIRVQDKKYLAEELRDIVVKTNPNGGQIYLHQIASIKDQWEDDVPSRSYFNGKTAVIIRVNNTLKEDVLLITETLRQYIQDFNVKHNEVKLAVIEDGSEVLTDRINLLRDNGVMGFILVIFILALFLNWRLAFWVGLAIPTSFAGMLIFAGYLGVTINLMSLFGMIIVIGILVDDGIVIAENIYQKYESGMPAKQAALEGTMEVLPAVFAAILTTIVAFASFFFIDGELGELGLELAIVVIVSLIFSLVEGALILPAHVAYSKSLKTGGVEPNAVQKVLNQFMAFLRDKTYKPVLNFAIDYPFPMLACCLVAMMIAVGAAQGGIIRNNFFPNIPAERFHVNLKMPAGTPADVTNRVLEDIEKKAWELNEKYRNDLFAGEKDLLTNLIRNVGPQSNEGSITVSLMTTEERGTLTARDISGYLRDAVGPVNEAEYIQYRTDGVFGKPLDISVLSRDVQDLEAASKDLENALMHIKELRDVTSSNSEGLNEISLTLKPLARSLGFTVGDIIGQVRQGYFGDEVQRLQRGVDEVKVWLRYESEDRSDIDNLSDMQIHGRGGVSVSLGELANFSTAPGVNAIYHLNGQQEIRLEAELANSRVLVAGIFKGLDKNIIPKLLKKYPSVKVVYNGQSREQGKTMASLKSGIMIMLLIMFFIIVLTFKSISQTLIVFVVAPFGFIGMGLGHYVMDIPITLVSMLGFTALIGVLVNDALVFITTFNDKLKTGSSFSDGLYQTGMSRFRPIVLTSVTTIFGLGPILLEKSLGAQLLIPMAVTLAFGLLIVTIIILAMIPALLKISNMIKVYSLSFWEGETITPRLVEPAVENRIYNFGISAAGAALVAAFFYGLVYFLWEVVKLLF